MATRTCLLSWGHFPPANLREWCHLLDMYAKMQGPTKMEEHGIGGENMVALHHTPGRDRDLCRHAKKCSKAQVFGRAREQLPKPFVRPTHHSLSSYVGFFNSHLIMGAEKHTTEQTA